MLLAALLIIVLFLCRIDDYRAHTSCISEAERYEGKLAKKPTKRNPQQEWMNVVETCVDTAPPHLKSYMRTMAGLDNIPRKEKQFRNFTANSLNLRGKNESIVGEIWELLKAEREKRQQQKEQQQQQQQKESKEDDEKTTKQDATIEKTKEPLPSTESAMTKDSKSDNNNKVSDDELDPKVVQKAMKKALKKAPNQSMKLKELRNLLGEKLGLPKSAKKQLKKLLETAPLSLNKTKVKVDGKMISLI